MLQYYATVDAGSANSTEVHWLTVEDVQDRSATFSDCAVLDEVTAMLGGQQSVGGVVTDTVGTSRQVNDVISLQMLSAHCRFAAWHSGSTLISEINKVIQR